MQLLLKNIKKFPNQSLGIRCASLVLLTMIFINFSCRKFIELDSPKTRIGENSVFESEPMATASVLGLYHLLIGNTSSFASGAGSGITLLAGLSADEFDNYHISTTATYQLFYENALNPVTNNVSNIWNSAYKIIYASNGIIRGVEKSEQITPETKKHLIAESKFVRAFCYFYLVNLFGDVPLVLTTDYREHILLSRASISTVYEQIINDLTDAKENLHEEYIYGLTNVSSTERTRPNKWAARAMLARVYLYLEDWVNAEAEATAVIEVSTKYKLLPNLNDVFLANSMETIWQLQPLVPNQNTWEGAIFVLTSPPGGSQRPVALSLELVNAFEPGDNRRLNWVQTYSNGTGSWDYAFKYKIQSGSQGTEYSSVLRLSEQYLIRAEARVYQNKLSGSNSAEFDVNSVRERALLSQISAADQVQLLTAIEQERRVELFAEWGHRWLDLKRTDKVDAIIGPKKGQNWQSTDRLFPIPETELLNGPNMSQNTGY